MWPSGAPGRTVIQGVRRPLTHDDRLRSPYRGTFDGYVVRREAGNADGVGSEVGSSSGVDSTTGFSFGFGSGADSTTGRGGSTMAGFGFGLLSGWGVGSDFGGGGALTPWAAPPLRRRRLGRGLDVLRIAQHHGFRRLRRLRRLVPPRSITPALSPR